jgi:FdhD protein
MELSKEHPIRRFRSGKPTSATDKVITETRVELDINDGEARVAMLALPQNLEALAVGFLLGEGILRDPEDLQDIQVSLPESKVVLRGDFDAEGLERLNRRWTWGTGCGGGGTSRDLDSQAYSAVGGGPTLAPETLLRLANDFHGRTTLWRDTGGVHACALADTERVILFAEDVGRHNAFDKVTGMAALRRIEVGDKLVLTTGRLSAEIVSKAVACGVPILASRAAVTYLAVTLARRFGLTLVGFLRGQRLNVYTGYDRIVPAGGDAEKETE